MKTKNEFAICDLPMAAANNVVDGNNVLGVFCFLFIHFFLVPFFLSTVFCSMVMVMMMMWGARRQYDVCTTIEWETIVGRYVRMDNNEIGT